jgi:hypothetical protein
MAVHVKSYELEDEETDVVESTAQRTIAALVDSPLAAQYFVKLIKEFELKQPETIRNLKERAAAD